MNILPKKRWHVRTKENIARVRKDEAEAAEKEREEKLRIENADREARLSVLKQKSKQKLLQSGISSSAKDTDRAPEHINLFENFNNAVQTTNKDHDKEATEKKEEYEKKIGYLTYLGQDTNEALGKRNWYEVPPEVSRFSRSTDVKDTYEKLVLKDEDGKPRSIGIDLKNGEVAWKSKQLHDPINMFSNANDPKKIKKNKSEYLSHKNETHKMKKNNKVTEKSEKLQKLREARLKREQQEKYKTDQFLRNLNKPVIEESNKTETNKIKPKYNSQFNPELARQNFR